MKREDDDETEKKKEEVVVVVVVVERKQKSTRTSKNPKGRGQRTVKFFTLSFFQKYSFL